MIAAGLLGVRDALEGRPEREEPAIVAEAPSQPHDRMELFLDPDDPAQSRVVFRRGGGQGQASSNPTAANAQSHKP